MRQVQAVDERLADIRVGVPREAAEPGFHGVYRFSDGREAGPVDHPLEGPDFLVGAAMAGVRDGDRRREIAESYVISAKSLQGEISIRRLVVRIGIDQRCWLVVEHLAKQGGDRFAFREPLAAQAYERPGRVGFVQRKEP